MDYQSQDPGNYQAGANPAYEASYDPPLNPPPPSTVRLRPAASHHTPRHGFGGRGHDPRERVGVAAAGARVHTRVCMFVRVQWKGDGGAVRVCGCVDGQVCSCVPVLACWFHVYHYVQ